MSVLSLCLSATARGVLYKAVITLCSLACLVSCLYVATAIVCHMRHSIVLRDLITIQMYKNMYLIMYLPIGVTHGLVAVVGLKLTWNALKQPINESLPRTHSAWAVFLVLFCVVTALAVSGMSSVQSSLQNQLLTRLKYGLSRYSSSDEWRATVDNIQTGLGCCGTFGYAEWYSTAWLPISAVTSKVDSNIYAKLVQPNGRVKAPLVPTSCCRDPMDSHCGHLAWLHEPQAGPSQADPSRLHEAGCMATIQGLVAQDMVFLKVLLLVMVLLQVASLVCFQYFYSSSFNSLVLGLPRGMAPGWLVGLGPPHTPLDNMCSPNLRKQEVGEIVKENKLKQYLKNIGRKCKQYSDSDGTPKSIRRLLNSPCLAKLKLKRKKKKKTEEATELDSEIKNIESYPQDPNSYDDDVKKSNIPKITLPSEDRNISDIQNVSLSKKRTLSKNLIDLEDELDRTKMPYNKNTTQVFQAELTNVIASPKKDITSPKPHVKLSKYNQITA